MADCPTGALVGPGHLDARRCLAWLVQAAALWAQAWILGSELTATAIAVIAAVDLLRYSLYILVFAVFVQVAISWINPDAPL